MNFSLNIFNESFIETIGWTLIHSLWQGALIAVLLAIALLILRKNSAKIRYNMAYIAMILLFITTVSTFFYLNSQQIIKSDELTTTTPITNNLAIEEASLEEVVIGLIQPTITESVTNKLYNALDNNLGLMVSIWMIGILIMSLRFLGNLVITQRLKHYKIRNVNKDWDIRIKDLAGDLGLNSNFDIKISEFVKIPMVIGWFRPLLILPVNLFVQLPYEQVEAIIIHELAHIRRNDFLHNLIQSFIEICLFYHPAIWWISSIMRIERENSCDDMVLDYTQDSLIYAKALTNLQEMDFSHHNGFAAALYNNKNQLLNRIKRMFGKHNITPSLKDSIVMILVLAFSITAIATTNAVPMKDSTLEDGLEMLAPVEDTIIITTNDSRQDIIYDTKDDDDLFNVTLYSDSIDYYLFNDQVIHKSKFNKDLDLLFHTFSRIAKQDYQLSIASQEGVVFFDTIIHFNKKSVKHKELKTDSTFVKFFTQQNQFIKYRPDSIIQAEDGNLSFVQDSLIYPLSTLYYAQLASGVDEYEQLFVSFDDNGDSIIFKRDSSISHSLGHGPNYRLRSPHFLSSSPKYIFKDSLGEMIVGSPEDFFIFNPKESSFLNDSEVDFFYDNYDVILDRFPDEVEWNNYEDFFVSGKFNEDLSAEERKQLKKDIEIKYKKLRNLKEDLDDSKIKFLQIKAQQSQEELNLEMLRSQKEVTYDYSERQKLDKKIINQKEKLNKINRILAETKAAYEFDRQTYHKELKEHKLHLHRNVGHHWNIGSNLDTEFFTTPENVMDLSEFTEQYDVSDYYDYTKQYAEFFEKSKEYGNNAFVYPSSDSAYVLFNRGDKRKVLHQIDWVSNDIHKTTTGYVITDSVTTQFHVMNSDSLSESQKRELEIIKKENIKKAEKVAIIADRIEQLRKLELEQIEKLQQLNELNQQSTEEAIQQALEREQELMEVREAHEELKALEEIKEIEEIEEIERIEKIDVKVEEQLMLEILILLKSDNLITSNEEVKLELSKKRFRINGKKQSRKLRDKYLAIYSQLCNDYKGGKVELPYKFTYNPGTK